MYGCLLQAAPTTTITTTTLRVCGAGFMLNIPQNRCDNCPKGQYVLLCDIICKQRTLR